MKFSECFWDYDIEEEDLLDLFFGRKQVTHHLDRYHFFERVLGYMNWYDFVKHLNRDLFLSIFDNDLIEKIKDENIKTGLIFVQKFLQK